MKKKRAAQPGVRPDFTPKIPAFKYSTRNTKPDAYRDRLTVLKKFGVKTSIRTNAKLTPQVKAAITRHVRRVAGYLNPANRVQFVKADPRAIRAAVRRGTVNPQQATGKGIFVQTPVSKHKTKVRINRKGELTTKTGTLVSSRKLFKTKDILRNPKLIEAEAKRRGAKSVFVSIRGFRSPNRYTPGTFNRYVQNRLLEAMREYSKAGKGLWKNHFEVEFITTEKTTKRKAKK